MFIVETLILIYVVIGIIMYIMAEASLPTYDDNASNTLANIGMGVTVIALDYYKYIGLFLGLLWLFLGGML